MRFALQQKIVTVLVVLSLGAAQALAQKPSADEAAANAALAERLAQMAQMTLAGKAIVPATLRQSAALLESANQLNPDEPRFLRLLTEAYLQLKGTEAQQGARSSLMRYLKLEPGDRAAQIQLIDLHFGSMESADQRKRYLEQLLGTESIPPEVRAHVAVLSAKLAIERGEMERSGEFLDQAAELFPLSPEALRTRYERLPSDAPPAARVALLLQLIRSNPSQPAVMIELGGRLAEVGLVDPSLTWYQTGFGLAQRLGMPPNVVAYTAYAAELVVADQLKMAEGFLGQLLENDPGNSDAAFLALLVEKRGGNAEKIQAASEKVRAALHMKLNALSALAHGREAPATQPADAPPPAAPDIQADVKKLAELGNSELTAAYAATLADLAWLDTYFNSKTAAAQPPIEALRQLVPSDSPLLARLEGWGFLADGKNDEAKVKLSAVAERDPLAALGMMRLEDDQSPQARTTDSARQLLAGNASGLVGAMLIEALRDRIGLMPAGSAAADVRAELDKFPREWLDILDFQKARNFYALKAEPLRVGHSFGEPVLAKVTITNTSRYDISLGPDGTIRPDLWFDAQIKGLVQQHIPGVAFERLGQKLVLKPKEHVSQVVRVDQDGLAQILSANPMIAAPLFFSVLTNPLTQQGGIAPGPGGYRVQFAQVVVRNASPLNDQTIQESFRTLQNGSGDDRIRTLELLGTIAGAMRQKDDPQLLNKATELIDVIRKSTGDSIPAVRAQATYTTAVLSDPAVREGILKQMLSDSAFPARVLGLAAIQQVVEPAQRKELAKPLAQGDESEVVKQLAASVIEVADLPPPATQPAEAQDTTAAGGTP